MTPSSGNLHRLGIPVTPYAQLVGTFGDTVFMQHTASRAGDGFEVWIRWCCPPGIPVDGLATEDRGARANTTGWRLPDTAHRRRGGL